LRCSPRHQIQGEPGLAVFEAQQDGIGKQAGLQLLRRCPTELHLSVSLQQPRPQVIERQKQAPRLCLYAGQPVGIAAQRIGPIQGIARESVAWMVQCADGRNPVAAGGYPLDALHQRSGAEPAAAAHADETVLTAAALQLVHRFCDQKAAGGAQRVSQ